VKLRSIEICAGGGGQALGLEQAGFEHAAVVELDTHACATLRMNRPYWNTIQADVTEWRADDYRGHVDLVAGGVPCPPFSKAGKQLGSGDERDLFPSALRIIQDCRPRAVLLENVRGLLDARFDHYRAELDEQLGAWGYETFWKLLQSADFGVPQLRPRTLLIALRAEAAAYFTWPQPSRVGPPTVGEALVDLMQRRGWEGARTWAYKANKIAPTLVGGSTRHGGPDLGPTRARAEWESLGVDGRRVATEPPGPGFVGNPCLTLEMTARLQGFPDSWQFAGSKTHAYRQIGNALPPPVARAVGRKIASALRAAHQRRDTTSFAAAA
jgi:DNA (cytosine-5)-methyltransferase 1